MPVQETYRERALPWKTEKQRTIERNEEEFVVHLLTGKGEMRVTDKLGTTAEIMYDTGQRFAVWLGARPGGTFTSVSDAVEGAVRLCIDSRIRLTPATARELMEAYFDEE